MTPTTIKPRKSSQDTRIDRILEAALAEFGRQGFAGAREGVIAREAGVAAATLKRLFPAKEELFREVVRSTIVSTLEAGPLTASRPVPEGGIARLKEFAQWFWRTMEEPSQAALLRLSVGELQRFPELAVFLATEVVGRAAHQLERILIESVHEGEFRIADPRVTARVILAALITHAQWFARPDIYGGLTGVDREGAEKAVIEVLLEALRAA
jgi:AcrR family transcriptional regulator